MAQTATQTSDKAESILDAALALFAERGFHGVAVPEVAQRAGCGAGTIYRYFANKEALVNALFQRHKSRIAGLLLTGFPAEAPAREQFHFMWKRLSGFVLDNPHVFEFLELHHHASYLDETSRALEERITQFGCAFIQRAQERREIKQLSPMLLIGFVLGGFTGLLRKRNEGHLEFDQATLDAAEQLAWEAIRS